MTSLAGISDTPIRVLYVNTDEDFTELVQTKLCQADADIEFIHATNARTAVETVSVERIDCVVTAYSLADETGIDLTESIRQQDEDLPIVLFTGQGSEEVASESTRAGITDYITIRTDRDNFELLVHRIQTLVQAARERRAAERINNRFQRTLERTADAIYAVDTEWRIEYMNEQMADRVGRDPETVVGTVLWEEFPTITGTKLEEQYRTAMETGEPISFEQYLEEPFDYWVKVRAFPDEDGLTVFSREITDERERQQELERNEAILQKIHDVVFVINEDGRIQFANSAAARVLERSRESLEEERLSGIVSSRVSDSDAREFKSAVTETLQEIDGDGGVTGLYDFDLQLGLRVGTKRRVFDVRLTPFQSTMNRQVLVVARDVTEQSQARNQLKRERDALRELQTVMADSELSTDDRLTELLEVGCQTTGLEIGIISKIEGDKYTVRSVHTPDGSIETGDRFDLESTYCEVVVAQDSVCAFSDAISAGKSSHPAYQQFELESYIGVPLVVDGNRYGTLNFSSPTTRESEFGTLERTFVELLAELVSSELSRDRSRTELEQTNQRLESLIEAAPLTIMEIDRDGEVLLWNRGAEQMFGWSREEVVGEFNPIVPKEGQSEFKQHRQQALRGERIRGKEIQRQTKDGERLDLLLSVAPITEAGGEVTSIIAVLDDTTEQKRLENQLRALQETAQQLSVARSREEIGDIAVEAAVDVLGFDITGIWRHDDRENALVPITETTAARERFSESPRFTPGDSLAWEVFESREIHVCDDVETSSSVYNPNTQIKSEIYVPLGDHGLISTGSTVGQRYSETEVDLFRILGATVEAALARADREEELRRQNERLNEFASVVAHDLRNPLTIASGFLEVVKETDDPTHYEKIESAHSRIERLIDDLLTLARGETLIEDTEQINLTDIATEAWGYVDTSQATLTVCDQAPVVAGNAGRLTQLFENLFRNAVEHGGTDVTITVGGLDDREGFYVEDDGQGISPERREDVFEHGVTSNKGGTGFGLSIVADIARAHGWTVSVAEGTDGGARFVFETDS